MTAALASTIVQLDDCLPSLSVSSLSNSASATDSYTLSLHDALPICRTRPVAMRHRQGAPARNFAGVTIKNTLARRCASPGKASPSRVLASRRRSEEHTSELQSPMYLVCRLLLETKNDCCACKHHCSARRLSPFSFSVFFV